MATPCRCLAIFGKPSSMTRYTQAGPLHPVLPFDYQRMVGWSVAIFVFCGTIAIVEPSPYDFASLLAIPLWFLGGFKVSRTLIVFLALLFTYNIGGFIALVPYWNEPDPVMFMLQSLYLAVTCVFFALYFSERTIERGELCLNAFMLSTVLASILGILGYFDVAGLGDTLSKYGRASGPFKDPNVLGSYVIMGALVLLQRIVLGRTKHLILSMAMLVVIVLGILLSFSRGSWGAFVISAILTTAMAWGTAATPAIRWRVTWMSALAVTLAVLGILALLSLESTREFFLQRASATQEYDVGETGRFGNQLRSLPMLLDRPFGFGPLRYRLIFGLEPHNSYINSIASYGWLGGFAFFMLVGTTTFVGFRLCLVNSPFQTLAQVFWPSLLVFLIQGLQIDIDHWRHVYLMLGAVWGLEAARMTWVNQKAGAAYAAAAALPRPSIAR